MNKEQKEVQQLFLKHEKQVINDLKKMYKESLDQVNEKIQNLLGRSDADELNVVYQIEYQKNLKTQIEGIMLQLQSKQFDTVSDYLKNSYNDGFIGTMYDMQNQGVPLIFPIDQKAVVNAIVNKSKLTDPLYERLGYDIKKLQKDIASEISRGLSTGLSYNDMARNIEYRANVTRNKAALIARTEAHRIQCQATSDAQFKAKEKGADVVKQWDAFLDGRTRKTHRELDGQIKELEEPFEYGRYKAMFPGEFGNPALDCNCRCALLQRAKWALDEAELETLNQRAAYFGLDKSKEFDDYKDKYLKAVEEDARVFKELTMDDFKKMKHSISKEERSIVYGKGHFSGYINSSNARKINTILREGGTLPKDYQEIANTLQNIIDKNTLNDDIIVTRYVHGDALESLIGVKVPQFKLSMKKDDFWNSIEAIPSQFKSGAEYIEKGFLSTSGVASENVMTDKLVKMNIKAPSGTNCYITTNNKESEIIFGKNTKLVITNCTIENSRQAGWKIVLDCIIE